MDFSNFNRRNHIVRVIELDFDPRAREEIASEATCVFGYAAVMMRILELPVAAWDCPTTASGEIDTERKRR